MVSGTDVHGSEERWILIGAKRARVLVIVVLFKITR